jgi:hypothetical protein
MATQRPGRTGERAAVSRYCCACRHPEHAAVDAALLAHTAGYRRIAARFGLKDTSLRRHEREHLGERLREQKDIEMLKDAASLVAELNRLHAYTSRALDAAEAQGDHRAVFLGVDAGGRSIERLMRLTTLSEIEARLNAVEADRESEHEHEHLGERRELFAETPPGRS